MKSPEVTANELIKKFWDNIKSDTTASLTINRKKKAPLYDTATQCAIICVEEILKNKHECGCEQSVVINGKYETYLTYWNQVLSLLKNKQQ